MNNQKQKMYLAPTIKVVVFKVENGLAVSDPLPTKSTEQLVGESGNTNSTNSGWDNGWND